MSGPPFARRAFEPARGGAAQARVLTLSKLGVSDRTRAVLKAFELKLVCSGPGGSCVGAPEPQPARLRHEDENVRPFAALRSPGGLWQPAQPC